MATSIPGLVFVPLGCSCITQFQLDFCFSKHSYDSQIFDWNLFTPDALINILESNYDSLLEAAKCIEIHYPGIIKAGNLPGYYWWHANKILGASSPINFKTVEEFEEFAGTVFRDKLTYQVEKFAKIQDSEDLIFIWSNAQPNLKRALPLHWENGDFKLTSLRYQKIQSLIRNYFPKSSIRFAARPEITDHDVLNQDNVYTISVPISNEHMGEPNLFSHAGIFDR